MNKKLVYALRHQLDEVCSQEQRRNLYNAFCDEFYEPELRVVVNNELGLRDLLGDDADIEARKANADSYCADDKYAYLDEDGRICSEDNLDHLTECSGEGIADYIADMPVNKGELIQILEEIGLSQDAIDEVLDLEKAKESDKRKMEQSQQSFQSFRDMVQKMRKENPDIDQMLSQMATAFADLPKK